MLRLVILLSMSVLLSGCPTAPVAVREASQSCQEEASAHFNGLRENDYQDVVVAEHWEKGHWENLAVSMRKDLMDIAEDKAEDHYRIAWRNILISCMSQKGYAGIKPPGNPVVYWYSQDEISPQNRVEPRKTVECLIDRECSSGFICDLTVNECIEKAPAVSVPKNAGGCLKDVDCKGDRICEEGVCVNPSPVDSDSETEESTGF